MVVKPETVIEWHRKGWRHYWRRKSLRGTAAACDFFVVPSLTYKLAKFRDNLIVIATRSTAARAYP